MSRTTLSSVWLQVKELYGIMKRGTSIITTSVTGKVARVQLSNVQYAAHLERNIVSYGLLEGKGYGISYRCKQRVVARINGRTVIFNEKTMNNILIVHVQDYKNNLLVGVNSDRI